MSKKIVKTYIKVYLKEGKGDFKVQMDDEKVAKDRILFSVHDHSGIWDDNTWTFTPIGNVDKITIEQEEVDAAVHTNNKVNLSEDGDGKVEINTADGKKVVDPEDVKKEDEKETAEEDDKVVDGKRVQGSNVAADPSLYGSPPKA